MRMKSKMAGFLLTMCVLLAGNTVMAAQQGNVYDGAELLSSEEISTLDQKITTMSEESGWNIYAVTTDNAEGKSATAYADDFFDAHSPEQGGRFFAAFLVFSNTIHNLDF